ncbi:MAG: HupE/UreJ family protein [Planctomycetes bacterium]|nr:HupE/UreJ family protein [Planctomycetota bacterium]
MLVCCYGRPAFAHDVEMTKVVVRFDAQGRYEVQFHYDVNAWMLGVRPEHLTVQEMARLATMPLDARDARLAELSEHVLRNVRIRFDEQKIAPAFDVMDNPDRPASQPTHGSSLLRIVRLSGDVPAGARMFDFWASRSFGNIVLFVSTESSDATDQQLLERGERSRPYTLGAGMPPASAISVARQYAVLGFEHILPKGLDHILFVLSLFLLSTRLGPLLWQITAFTLAHSVTLALSTYGVVTLSPRIVEPLIALSIAAVAVENLFTTKLHPWRPIVVFIFGLLHGLGFAGVLSELGLPRNQFATALISFNVGVELGQLSVIVLAFAAVGWLRSRVWYRPRVVVPCSLLIGATGLFWTVQRIAS